MRAFCHSIRPLRVFNRQYGSVFTAHFRRWQSTTTTSNISPSKPPSISTHENPTSPTLSDYTVSFPPTLQQLRHARSFFALSARPPLIYSTSEIHKIPTHSRFPEVIFLGRSNVGKSSLLNALLDRTNEKPAHVSKKPGHTRMLNAFGVGGKQHQAPNAVAVRRGKSRLVPWQQFTGSLLVVDSPGYGSGSRAEWGNSTLRYLRLRKQLRRVFVLIDSEHGLQKFDKAILAHLRTSGAPFQIILTKIDKVLSLPKRVRSVSVDPERWNEGWKRLRKICEEVRRQVNEVLDDGNGRDAVGDILCCSAEKTDGTERHGRMGIDELRWAVVSACGLEKGKDVN